MDLLHLAKDLLALMQGLGKCSGGHKRTLELESECFWYVTKRLQIFHVLGHTFQVPVTKLGYLGCLLQILVINMLLYKIHCYTFIC